MTDKICSRCKGKGVVPGPGKRSLRFVRCNKCVGSGPELKNNKFSAVKTSADGIKFASKREEKRYQALVLAQKAGVITDLKPHPSWLLANECVTVSYPTGRVARYTADFSYIEAGELVVEDVKSKPTMTEAATLRLAVFTAIHGIEVRIVT